MFGSADLAGQYGARVAKDIASNPDYDRGAGTVVVVVDATGTEIAPHGVEGPVEAVEVRARRV
ncbi:uncharacterized protein NK6_a_147 (plasmid) [Bradyrhizobium diazoefficiens]|nr:uncharacterized protein NK6_a_147 [Bradyrhizobium diazoefficiens]